MIFPRERAKRLPLTGIPRFVVKLTFWPLRPVINEERMKPTQHNFARESRFAKSLYGDLPKAILHALKELIQRHQILLTNGDVRYLDGGWYVTHSGLL